MKGNSVQCSLKRVLWHTVIHQVNYAFNSLEQTNLKVLEDFVKKSRKLGKSNTEIKNKLIKAGWSPDIVEKVLKKK